MTLPVILEQISKGFPKGEATVQSASIRVYL